MPDTDTLALAHDIADLAAEKLATEISILDMREVASYTDYFVVCTARNPRAAQAIADELRTGLKERRGVSPRRINGERESNWILIDYLDVVVHIFTPEARDFYRLEQLWGEAPRRAVAG